MNGGREGFTTGSCAAAAAKAAARLLLLGERDDGGMVDIPAPPSDIPRHHAASFRPRLPLAALEPAARGVLATVVKDAGDDPDVTHGAAIQAFVSLEPSLPPGAVVVEGGTGVGRVTRLGLPVPVGEAAINPGPRRQIELAVLEVLAEASPGAMPGGLRVEIRVPEGEALAARTLNPRLGIVGGISILGTRGTVKPFSHAAWKATLRQCLDVSPGMSAAVLATGGRSEALARGLLPHVPEHAFLQAGDFLAFALRAAARRGRRVLVLAMYLGKCYKLAMGHGFTHARASTLSMHALAGWTRALGHPGLAAEIALANTARHALDMLDASPHGAVVLELVHRRALAWAERMAGPLPDGSRPRVHLLLFDHHHALRLPAVPPSLPAVPPSLDSEARA